MTVTKYKKGRKSNPTNFNTEKNVFLHIFGAKKRLHINPFLNDLSHFPPRI